MWICVCVEGECVESVGCVCVGVVCGRYGGVWVVVCVFVSEIAYNNIFFLNRLAKCKVQK